jgi:translation initiation factor 3 subunit L
MDGIQLNKKALFARVASAYFTTYYYVGFSYLMLHRYADAIKAFSHILLYISRTKNINRSAQFDQVTKKSEQMYALLAMCVTLSPTRLDDVIHTGLREKYGDQLVRMQRGGPESIKTFEELFLFAAPKFISPSPCELNDPQAVVDPIQHHLQVFLATVQNATLGTTLKSYLNLYATMDISKLSSFLDTNVDDLRSALVCFKLKNRQIKWTEGRLLNGDCGNVSDIDIILEGDLIHIAETKGGRKFADWFIRNTAKNYSVQDYIASPDRDYDKARPKRSEKK